MGAVGNPPKFEVGAKDFLLHGHRMLGIVGVIALRCEGTCSSCHLVESASGVAQCIPGMFVCGVLPLVFGQIVIGKPAGVV